MELIKQHIRNVILNSFAFGNELVTFSFAFILRGFKIYMYVYNFNKYQNNINR